MKQAVIIINPHSGRSRESRKKREMRYQDFLSLFAKYGYSTKLYKTQYPKHAKEIVKNLPDDIDLVVSVGGDGTFNETVVGNFERKKRLVLSHLPYGTTNDIGALFGLGKNPHRNLEMILSGVIKKIDICMINGHPFVYSGGFGKFMDVPYETSRNMKKHFGQIAYFFHGVRDFFQRKTPLYELTYEVNGEKYHGLYSFALVSNANRIAGINNFYHNVKLDDHLFEVAFCNLRRKKDIVRSLIYLRLNDITKVPGFYFHKTDHLKIKFHDKLKKPWCLDGEKFPIETNEFDIRIEKDVPMMVAKTALSKMFLTSEEEHEGK